MKKYIVGTICSFCPSTAVQKICWRKGGEELFVFELLCRLFINFPPASAASARNGSEMGIALCRRTGCTWVRMTRCRRHCCEVINVDSFLFVIKTCMSGDVSRDVCVWILWQ